MDGCVVERQLLHVGDGRLEARVADTGGLHDRGGDVDAHHALGAREEQPTSPSAVASSKRSVFRIVPIRWGASARAAPR